LSHYLDYRPDVRGEYFYIDNHCRRLTQNFVVFTRSHVEVRIPFFDYALFDFLYSLPAEVRGNRKLYRSMIQKEMPGLANIPYDNDEFLPTTRPFVRGIHAEGVKLKRRINRHVMKVFPERRPLYADYEEYLRGELREWAENILYDRRTTERGIFEPLFLRSLMQRHLSNLEEWTIGKIAPLITYEMMLRRYYD
jgi:asparagine synthase (glutamine-hydrolysing)